MSPASPSFRIEALGLAAILAAGAVVLWQQRALTRLGGTPPAMSPPEARAAVLAAQQRVAELEKQLAGRPNLAPPAPAPAAPRPEEIKKLQLQVDGARSRESIRSAYGPLIKALGLDPATAAKFEGLVARERLTARDALAAAQAQGIQSFGGYKAAVEGSVGQEDEEISALLSPAGFAQFDAYRQTLPEQETVAQLAERLAGTPAPLGEGQQAQLVQLINQLEPPVYRQNQAFLSVIGMDGAPLTPAIVNAAPSILSPPQTSALQAMEASWLAKAQLQQALRPRAPSSAASPSP